MKARAEQLVRVALTTTRGRIVLDLDRGRFNGIGFYRAMKSGPGGLIQSGITDAARKLFPAIRHEPTRGSGAMKGQMLEPVVRIAKAERVKRVGYASA